MPGGGKGGSSPAGQTTVSQTPWNAPFLQRSFENAGSLYDNNALQYYPGQTYAQPNEALTSGYANLAGTAAANDAWLRPAGNGIFASAAMGGMSGDHSPAFSGFADVANHQFSPWQTQTFNDIALQGMLNSGEYRTKIDDLAGRAPGATSGTADYLAGLAPGAVSTGGAFADAASRMATLAPDSVSPFAQSLMRNAGSAGFNPGISALRGTARGDFLNSNPYIDKTFDAASDGVTRAYQTATAPQADSAFETAGRYGSGAHANRADQNELNLGSTLDNLATGIYGGNYANERGLMAKAGTDLGNLYLGGLGASTSAASAGGNLALGGIDTAARGLVNAGNLDLSAFTTGGNLAASGANTRLAGINSGISGYNTGFGTANTGMNSALTALTAGGGLDIANLGARNTALSGLQSAFSTGNSDALKALALYPSVIDTNYSGARAQIQGGQGLTGLDQSNIADLMARFYGVQEAPWKTAERYSGLVGNPIQGSTTTPYFTNPTANALSTGIGGLGLLNGANTAFGSGGALSGLFGGGSQAASVLGGAGETALLASAGIGPATAAELGGVAAGGKGLSSILPAFLGSDRRLKEDIRHVGKLGNGLPVYSFRYRGDPATHIGLMADEVELVHPSAVVVGPAGYKMVNYALAVQ